MEAQLGGGWRGSGGTGGVKAPRKEKCGKTFGEMGKCAEAGKRIAGRKSPDGKKGTEKLATGKRGALERRSAI